MWRETDDDENELKEKESTRENIKKRFKTQNLKGKEQERPPRKQISALCCTC